MPDILFWEITDHVWQKVTFYHVYILSFTFNKLRMTWPEMFKFSESGNFLQCIHMNSWTWISWFCNLLYMVGLKLLVWNDNVHFAIRSKNRRSWGKAALFPLAIKAAGCFQFLWIHKTTVIARPFVELHIHWDILTCSNELLGCTWTDCIS